MAVGNRQSARERWENGAGGTKDRDKQQERKDAIAWFKISHKMFDVIGRLQYLLDRTCELDAPYGAIRHLDKAHKIMEKEAKRQAAFSITRGWLKVTHEGREHSA